MLEELPDGPVWRHPRLLCLGESYDVISLDTYDFDISIYLSYFYFGAADSTDKVIAGVTLGMIGLGSLATVAILLWALFVRRRSRSSGDDEGLLIN